MENVCYSQVGRQLCSCLPGLNVGYLFLLNIYQLCKPLLCHMMLLTMPLDALSNQWV